jgi:hypothetical protein
VSVDRLGVMTAPVHGTLKPELGGTLTHRKPPHWPPHTDRIARECGVRIVTFTRKVEPGTRCHYCGGEGLTRDHVVPDSVGGAPLWWNLVPSCNSCNESKADRQACACMFCVRAIALWSLGFRREGKSYREKKRANVRSDGSPAPLTQRFAPEQAALLSALLEGM